MGKWVGGMRLVKDSIVLRVEAEVEVEGGPPVPEGTRRRRDGFPLG